MTVTDEIIISKIYHFRGQKVMLDSDLAELYEVETKRLKEQVKRNINRFPASLMFELTEQEFILLRSQIAISKNWTRRHKISANGFYTTWCSAIV